MIDFDKATIQVPGHLVEPIREWRVWFVTVEGTFATLDEAKGSCDKTNQPYYSIIPVCVACGITTFEIRQ